MKAGLAGCLALVVSLITVASDATAQHAGTAEVPPQLTGGVLSYTVSPGDSVARLSARFGVPAVTLRSLNHLRADAVLRPGDVLLIDNRHIAPLAGTLTLNVPQRMLYLADGQAVRAFPVAVGRSDWPTPIGAFTIIQKERDPVWDVPLSIQDEMRRLGQPVLTSVPAGPDNPLGAFFIRLSFGGIGFHGTNAPASIYRFVTHGCVRLNARDIAELYERVTVGMSGAIIYQPVLLTTDNGRVWLEVHPDPYRRASAARAATVSEAERLGITRIDWKKATLVILQARGIAVDVTAQE